jgi:hypothetical protein
MDRSEISELSVAWFWVRISIAKFNNSFYFIFDLNADLN